ncbi:MAG: hypothetical protein DHS20C17_21580 [Cyclobacteriaceae bacterium]|nr:MAG: hypothetical protein DHS20C17_21580 [Cyclobacteriaceae bacterium]
MSNRLLVLIFLIVASACSRKVTVTDPDFVKDNKLVFSVQDFSYLNTRTKIQYKDEDRSVSTSANIRIKKDSIIWMSLTPLFGIEVARALITKDSLILLNRLNKEYMVYDFKNLSEKFQFDINYHLIQSLILGNMPLEYQDMNEIVSSKQFYIIKQQSGPYSIDNYINRQLMKLQKVEVSEEPKKNKMIMEFDDHQKVEMFTIPFHSLISLDYEHGEGLKSTEINIKHGHAELASALRFPFEIPSRYERK